MLQSFDPVKALFLIAPEDFFLLPGNLKFMFFHCLHVPDQRTKGIVLLYLDQIAALQLTVQIHGTVSRNLGLSFFQFTVTDLQAIFQSRKFLKLTIRNTQKTAVLQTKIFFLTVISGKDIKKLRLIHAFYVHIQIQKPG